jgi:hypothetical protein
MVTGWRLLDAAGDLILRADRVALAAGAAIGDLAPEVRVRPVRGQASWTPAARPAPPRSAAMPSPRATACCSAPPTTATTRDRRPARGSRRNLETLAKGLPESGRALKGKPFEAAPLPAPPRPIACRWPASATTAADPDGPGLARLLPGAAAGRTSGRPRAGPALAPAAPFVAPGRNPPFRLARHGHRRIVEHGYRNVRRPSMAGRAPAALRPLGPPDRTLPTPLGSVFSFHPPPHRRGAAIEKGAGLSASPQSLDRDRLLLRS